MKDRIYESCQSLALGLLVGYLGLYALDWMKTWSKEKTKNSQEQKSSEKPLTNV